MQVDGPPRSARNRCSCMPIRRPTCWTSPTSCTGGSSRDVTSPSPPWWRSAAARPGSRAPHSPWTPTARRSARSPAAAWRARCTSCARQALEDGATVLERFGYSDEDAFAVGLTCGGVIDILVTPGTRRARPHAPCSPPRWPPRRAAGRRRSPGSWRGRRSCWAARCCVPAEASSPAASAAPPGWTARPSPRPAPCSTRAVRHGADLGGGRTSRRGRARRLRRRGRHRRLCGPPLTLLVESSARRRG